VRTHLHTPQQGDNALAGQVAIVAGAGSGIGRAAALRLAASGVQVVLADRHEEGMAHTRDLLVATGATVSVAATDITNEDSVENLINVARSLGPVSILVNSVGITGPLDHRVHELPLAQYRQTFDVNLWGAVVLTKAVLPEMIERQYGRIVHVSSIAGKEGNPKMAPYNITKAGLIGFVKGAAKEYATEGITINAIAPAVVSGPLVDSQPEDVRSSLTAKVPMGRMGQPEEIAEVIAFAVSPACSFTTGFVFDASGGRATY
jgi:NAD(P)-dependent dehydrogenase (short-subunit alcohol dehydrogenase family)